MIFLTLVGVGEKTNTPPRSQPPPNKQNSPQNRLAGLGWGKPTPNTFQAVTETIRSLQATMGEREA
ncbi:hypothetical protein ACJ79_gp44 [Propionibacterium phage PHL199M00]|uniref:Uncharacterized protein n=1 Tax=Propionibacterium phage PHL199M00 TaxID=1500830 RepID=A0A0E3DN80_9CAUD|nr:hypothetical protein ACJ79_gp44 [Propionibacterium phage PHL199M00]AII30075.1 hypothetical protein PHL199M00_44 [Propionibacterium phage PHL199M00]